MKSTYTQLRPETSEDLDEYAHKTSITTKVAFACALQYAIHVDHYDFVAGLDDADHAGNAHQIQVEVDDYTYSWIEYLANTTHLYKKGVTAACVRFCLYARWDDFDAYVLDVTPEPDITPGTSIKHENPIDGPVDKYMEMDSEEVREATRRNIESLGEE